MATKPYSPPFERWRILSPKPEAQWGESGTEKWSMRLRCGGKREQLSDSEKLEEERLIISSLISYSLSLQRWALLMRRLRLEGEGQGHPISKQPGLKSTLTPQSISPIMRW